jgi:putative restriction endonuclease
MSNSVHKDIGYDIMQYLNDAFPDSKLVNINKNDCYEKLLLTNGCSIDYTKWRDGTMPFYIILYNKKRDYIFELDLSMLLYDKDHFQWHFKPPKNKETLSVLQDKLGEQFAFPENYVTLVRNQKSDLSSGVNTPRKGFNFLLHANWDKLTEQLLDLVVSIFSSHNIKVTSIKPKEAEDDGDWFVSHGRRARRGQRKLRLNLLKLYNSQCAITGDSPTEVLEAAHIVSHADSGINHSKNGLLLRADIHSLFDSNLLRIEPETLKVTIDTSLSSTSYWKLNGIKLRKRSDGSIPSKKYLEKRWFGEDS